MLALRLLVEAAEVGEAGELVGGARLLEAAGHVGGGLLGVALAAHVAEDVDPPDDPRGIGDGDRGPHQGARVGAEEIDGVGHGAVVHKDDLLLRGLSLAGLAPEIDALFFEEARDMLAQIEQCVLELEEKPNDVEELNALFRCAHTIKGSAGLFGLNAVVGFTHHVETLLDELRNGTMQLDLALSSLLFGCRDHIAVLLEQARTGKEPDSADREREQSLLGQLQAAVSGGDRALEGQPDPADAGCAAPVLAEVVSGRDGTGDWQILARFRADTFRDGFDPLSVIAYLSTVARVRRVVPRLPADLSFDACDPETCHLSFEIRVGGEASLSTLESAFELVREDCELTIWRDDPVPPALPADDGLPTADDRLGDLLVRQGNLTRDVLGDALRAQYDLIDPETYAWADLSDDDFKYTWVYFEAARNLWQKAADAGRAVIFTVDH